MTEQKVGKKVVVEGETFVTMIDKDPHTISCRRCDFYRDNGSHRCNVVAPNGCKSYFYYKKADTKSKAIFISGEICSGKDTYANQLIKSDPEKYVHIGLGDIVRKVKGTTERVFDNNMEPVFEKEIEAFKNENLGKTVIITGFRQPSLIKLLSKLFDKTKLIYLLVPESILFERYEKRADKKDENISFSDARKGDESLGMKELILFLVRETRCKFIKNY